MYLYIYIYIYIYIYSHIYINICECIYIYIYILYINNVYIYQDVHTWEVIVSHDKFIRLTRVRLFFSSCGMSSTWIIDWAP